VLIEGADDESTESVVAQEPTDPTAAGTGGGVDGNRYVSPDYGWSLDWDGAAWAEDSVSNELELVAVGEGEGPDGLGRVRFLGIEGYDGDAAACLSAIAEVFDQELPEVTEEGSRAFATTEPYLATEDLDGDGTIGAEGEAVAARMYLECRPLGTDGILLGISFSDRADRFAERFPAVEVLVASVETSAVAESAAPNSTAPTAPTGSPAEPPVSSTPSDAYASDAFDFALTWDPGRWELLQERNDDGTERLVLSDGTSTVDLYPFRRITRSWRRANASAASRTSTPVSTARVKRKPLPTSSVMASPGSPSAGPTSSIASSGPRAAMPSAISSAASWAKANCC
jgi:hypothetical protein